MKTITMAESYKLDHRQGLPYNKRAYVSSLIADQMSIEQLRDSLACGRTDAYTTRTAIKIKKHRVKMGTDFVIV